MSALFGDRANTLKELPNDGLNEDSVTGLIVDHLEG